MTIIYFEECYKKLYFIFCNAHAFTLLSIHGNITKYIPIPLHLVIANLIYYFLYTQTKKTNKKLKPLGTSIILDEHYTYAQIHIIM